jgi:hypothetical protein
MTDQRLVGAVARSHAVAGKGAISAARQNQRLQHLCASFETRLKALLRMTRMVVRASRNPSSRGARTAGVSKDA